MVNQLGYRILLTFVLLTAAWMIPAAAESALVSYWSLDGTAADAEGDNDAILGPTGLDVGHGVWDYTAPNWTAGKFGLGLDFSGATYPGPGDAVMVPNSPSLNSSRFTVSTWINTTQTANYAGYVSKAWGTNIGDPGGWSLDYTSGLRGSVQSNIASFLIDAVARSHCRQRPMALGGDDL